MKRALCLSKYTWKELSAALLKTEMDHRPGKKEGKVQKFNWNVNKSVSTLFMFGDILLYTKVLK